MTKIFASGNEAFAQGIRLARPDVISAYPITPQTIVVERLADMVADGSLDAEFVHVESEHSALSCAMGASAVGARTFTATSSQGLMYMAECLPYAAGGRFPIVMMNANRSLALPWNIYGDQRDSILLLDSGWIQAYAENAQESLDLAIMSYRIAEDREVSTPFMANLDGFHLTHTYEGLDVPDQGQVDDFLPPFETDNRFDMDSPRNLGFSAGPEHNMAFKAGEHRGMMRSVPVISKAEEEFSEIIGRDYTGLLDPYLCDDADYILITLGSVSGLCRKVADSLRSQGVKAGVLRIRYLRPFPASEISKIVNGAKGAVVLEKDISFGYQGTVFTNVCSALFSAGVSLPVCNRIGGLGGADTSAEDIRSAFQSAIDGSKDVSFIGLGVVE